MVSWSTTKTSMPNNLEIYESNFEFSDWDASKYFTSEVMVSVSSAQTFAGTTAQKHLVVFGIKLGYHFDYNEKRIFSFEGHKNFSFPKSYISIHLLHFLTEISIKEFDVEFLYKKGDNGIYMQDIEPRELSTLFDMMADTLSLLRSQETTT